MFLRALKILNLFKIYKEPKNIDELLRIYENEPGLLDNSIGLQNANDYNQDDDDNNDSNEDADDERDESLTNYQLPIVKKLIREEDDDDSLSEDAPLKLTDGKVEIFRIKNYIIIRN